MSAGLGDSVSRIPDIPWATILSLLREAANGDEPSVSLVMRERPDPFSVLVSTIISLRTKDAVTVVSSQRLLARGGTPEALVALTEEEIGTLIYPAGFYRTKARTLRTIAAILLEKYEGRVPSTMEELLALPGVGRKTANLVLSEGFGIDALCVDTHVHRISNRTGWVRTKDPEGTEMELRRILPRDFWREINPLLVLYGQRTCTPQSPRCSICRIRPYCARVGVERSR